MEEKCQIGAVFVINKEILEHIIVSRLIVVFLGWIIIVFGYQIALGKTI
jgi:hypothetical protein